MRSSTTQTCFFITEWQLFFFFILPFSFHFLRFQGPSVLPLTFWICWIHLSYLCPFSLYTGIQWNRSEQGCQGVVEIGPKCTQLIHVEPGSKFLWFTQGILWVRDGCGTGHFAKNHAWEHWFSVFLQIPCDTIYLGTVSFPITAAPPSFLLGGNKSSSFWKGTLTEVFFLIQARMLLSPNC